MMLLNLSNHPSSRWSEEQKKTAEIRFGEIVDLPFPQVDPFGDEAYIGEMADEYCQKVMEMADDQVVTVHLMGEMTFTYALATRLMAKGISCVASTTERIIVEEAPDRKTAVFRFVRFRNYE